MRSGVYYDNFKTHWQIRAKTKVSLKTGLQDGSSITKKKITLKVVPVNPDEDRVTRREDVLQELKEKTPGMTVMEEKIDGTKCICLNDLNLAIIPANADGLNLNSVSPDSDEDDNVPTPTNVPTTDNTDGKSKEKHGSTPHEEGGLPALLDLPMKDIVSNKSNKKISKEIPPQRTHILVKDRYIPVEDPYFKDSPKEIKTS